MHMKHLYRLFLALIAALLLAFTLTTLPTNAHPQLPSQVQQAHVDALGELNIENGTDSDAQVKVIDLSTNSVAYTVEIPAHQSDSITEIADGKYAVAFWVGTKTSGYGKVFKDPLVYETTETDEGTRYKIYTLTLQPVAGGNAQTENISAGTFDSLK